MTASRGLQPAGGVFRTCLPVWPISDEQLANVKGECRNHQFFSFVLPYLGKALLYNNPDNLPAGDEGVSWSRVSPNRGKTQQQQLVTTQRCFVNMYSLGKQPKTCRPHSNSLSDIVRVRRTTPTYTRGDQTLGSRDTYGSDISRAARENMLAELLLYHK